MTQDRSSLAEGASVRATPAPEAPATAALQPSDAPTSTTLTLESAREEIERQAAAHEELTHEHKRPTSVELGKQQVAALEAELMTLHGQYTGPLAQLHGLQVIPVNEDDRFALVYQGVAGA